MSMSRQSNERTDELTWLDYLRAAGAAVRDDRRPGPPQRRESRDSADRKRRHTGPEPERRNHPYPPSIPPSDAAMPSGSSRATAIDLTSPPPPRRGSSGPRGSYPGMHGGVDSRSSSRAAERCRRRESDTGLPRWQPDHEVSKCPVCDAEFSMLYRRHHCRKCGRVVCNRCSPHRITIPRQYIVQPPNQYVWDDDARSPSPASRANPALGGGEVVRVCNPCVPDPWTPDTTNNAASVPAAPVPPLPSLPPHHLNDNTSGTAEPGTAEPGAPNMLPHLPHLPQLRAQSRSGSNPGTQRPPQSRFDPRQSSSTPPPHNQRLEQLLASARAFGSSGGGPPTYPSEPPPPPHPSLNPFNATLTPQGQVVMPPPPVPGQSPPRRQVREEDECPVCGEEMPPGQEVREAHIKECIATRFSSTPTHSAARPLPIPGAAHVPGAASHTLEASRPRAGSFRPRGMFKSKATEKDCVGADGEPQECIICLDEFEPGDELGTMECWCKFHRDCIRGWWERKGAGSCPTHRLYD